MSGGSDRAAGGAAGIRAFVAFAGTGKRPWSWFLKPGFRHCFVMLDDGRGWITVEPLSSRIDVARQELAPGEDLPARYLRQGHIVLPAPLARPETADWPQPFTCVAVVKRVLGLRAALVLTPWQLYRHLLRRQSGERLS
ncbi:MAG: hypothetical protein RLO50_01465 [Azospirillaceae bacterium]